MERQGDKRPLRERGVRMNILNVVMMLAAVLTFAMLVGNMHGSNTGYRDMREATERYLTCQRDVMRFQEISDYLTDECRHFVITGDNDSAARFIEEVETMRSREEVISDFLQNEPSFDYLSQALEYSDELIEVECRAMHLAGLGHGVPVETLPERIQSAALTADELALDAEAQRDRAVDMVFGAGYIEAKGNIWKNVQKGIEELAEERIADQIDRSNRLNHLLTRQFMLSCALMAIMLLIIPGVHILIMRPIRHCVRSIRNQERMTAEGSFEIRFLANSYNEMFDKNTRRIEALSYSATHDSITGLYNRTAYDAARLDFDERSVCVLIIDVDGFKTFNDTFGHDVGDKVLKKVAGELRACFRTEDFVSRIGGDEFCVVMKNIDSSLKDIVFRKVDQATRRLKEPKDGLPPITLSVGAAFGDRENPSGDVFKDADTALYRVKRRGRDGMEIY